MGAFIYGKETMPTTGDDNNVAQWYITEYSTLNLFASVL